MAKKIIISSIVILVICVVGVIVVLNYDFLQSVVSGFSTLSLTQANLQSANPYLDGQAWILTVRQGGLGQRAYGTITPTDVQSQTPGDQTTTKNLNIEVQYENQECVTTIGSTSLFTPIYAYGYIEWTYVPLVSPCDLDEAKERLASSPGASVIQVGKPAVSATCYAVYRTGEQSPVGNFGNTDVRSRMDVSITANGKTDFRVLDTEGSTQGPVGSNAYVIWQGNLDTGKSCPFTTDNPYRPAYVNGYWRVVSKNAYDNYLSWINTIPTVDNYVYWVTQANYRASQAKVSQSFGTIDNAYSLSSAVLRSSIEYASQYPVLTFYVKADTLGIYTPAPEIALRGATSSCFKTGEQGLINIDAENIGDESGVWSFYGSCPSSTFDITQSREYGLSAGERRTVTLPISGSASSKQTGTCTVYAEGVSGTKQISVSVCVDPQQTCTPGAKFCGFSGGVDVVKQCSADGATSQIVDTCDVGESCIIDQCLAEGETPENGEICGAWIKLPKFLGGATIVPDLWCILNNWIKEFKIIFAVVMGFLSGIIGGFLFNSLIRKVGYKVLWPAFVSALVIGLAIGFLAYFYFWLALISLVILVIVRVVL